MSLHSNLRRATAIAAALALALLPATPAMASGFQLVEQNASGLGNAYSGQAAAVKDASAVFLNPAALTRLEGFSFAVSVSPIGVATEFADGGSSQPFLPTSPPTPASGTLGGVGGDAGGWTPVPNVYLSYQAAENLWLGMGVNVPFGLATEWEDNWMGRFHGIHSEIHTINLNPTVAFKVSDVFSIGAGASYQKLDATLTQAVPYGGIAFGTVGSIPDPATRGALLAGLLPQLGASLANPFPALGVEGGVDIEGDSWAWGFNGGALVQLGDNGYLGLTYRSKIEHTVEGDAVFSGWPGLAGLGPVSDGLNAAFSDGAVTTVVDLPDVFSAAVAYEGEKVDVMADWTRTGWSSIQDLTIDRADGTELSSVPLNFEDTWRAGLGINYKLNDSALIRLGGAYDKSPVQDEFRTPRLPDTDRYWIAGGFQWKPNDRGAIDVGYAHIFIDDASSNLSNQASPTDSPRGNLVGTYAANVNIFSIQYSMSF